MQLAPNLSDMPNTHFHGGDTGSVPVRDAISFHKLSHTFIAQENLIRFAKPGRSIVWQVQGSSELDGAALAGN
jgi:hypothetical protein